MSYGEHEKQTIKTDFQFQTASAEEQTQSFEHTVLNPMDLQQEIETARLSEQVFQDVRTEIQGHDVQIRQAPEQVNAPQPAPRELSYKERRAQAKQREKNLKRGKTLTPHADELTANLVDRQQAMNEDIRRFSGFDAARNDVFEQVKDTLRTMQNVKVTADMFTDENYVDHYANLQDLLQKSSYMNRIAADRAMMAQLRENEFSLYGTVLRWQRLHPLLEQMIRTTNHAHGLNENGEVLRDDELSLTQTVTLENGDETEVVIPNIITHTRANFSTVLSNFRTAVEEQENAHQETLLQAFQSEYEEELNRQKINKLMGRTEDQEEREWIQSPSLTYGSENSYGKIQELRDLIGQSSEVYLANKDIVDKMFSDIIRRYEVLGELAIQSNTWEEIKSRYQNYENNPRGGDGDRLCRHAAARINQMMTDKTNVENNLTSISSALTRFLEGTRPNALEIAVLETYGCRVIENSLNHLAGCRAKRTAWQKGALQSVMEKGLFTTEHPESTYVTRPVTLFRQGDDAYNAELLNILSTYEKENQRKPLERTEEMSDTQYAELFKEDYAQRKAYYDTIRRIVEPEVNRILAWDMERYLQMDDQQLMEAQAELDDLFGANMFTSDLMKLGHPKLRSYSMKNDILGDRLDEFSHKLSVLRALTDKSRGLLLKALIDLGQPIEEHIAGSERGRAYGALVATLNNPLEAQKQFADQQIDLGNRLLNTNLTRWNAWRDVNSEAFQTACMTKYKNVGALRNIADRDTPLDEVAERYSRHFLRILPDATQVERDVVKRLANEQYRIACWDKLDARIYARERGLDPDTLDARQLNTTMGEPLFRVFSSYAATPGGMTQTPEEFQQMLQELSAGAELERGVSSERDIFEARETNMRGALRFKESLRLSYDYLSRKYGFGLETVSALDIYDHHEEILRDFGNVQVDMSFINRIPGIVDMENEEDKALFNKINYFAVFSKSVQDMLLLIGDGNSAEHTMTLIRNSATGPTAGPNRAVLMEMGAAAGMASAVTWGNAVKVGERRELPPEDAEAKELRWQEFQHREELYRQEKLHQEEQRQ